MERSRILAVDDNSISLATIEQELKRDYEVIPMNSGERAPAVSQEGETEPDPHGYTDGAEKRDRDAAGDPQDGEVQRYSGDHAYLQAG